MFGPVIFLSCPSDVIRRVFFFSLWKGDTLEGHFNVNLSMEKKQRFRVSVRHMAFTPDSFLTALSYYLVAGYQ